MPTVGIKHIPSSFGSFLKWNPSHHPLKNGLSTSDPAIGVPAVPPFHHGHGNLHLRAQCTFASLPVLPLAHDTPAPSHVPLPGRHAEGTVRCGF